MNMHRVEPNRQQPPSLMALITAALFKIDEAPAAADSACWAAGWGGKSVIQDNGLEIHLISLGVTGFCGRALTAEMCGLGPSSRRHPPK